MFPNNTKKRKIDAIPFSVTTDSSYFSHCVICYFLFSFYSFEGTVCDSGVNVESAQKAK